MWNLHPPSPTTARSSVKSPPACCSISPTTRGLTASILRSKRGTKCWPLIQPTMQPSCLTCASPTSAINAATNPAHSTISKQFRLNSLARRNSPESSYAKANYSPRWAVARKPARNINIFYACRTGAASFTLVPCFKLARPTWLRANMPKHMVSLSAPFSAILNSANGAHAPT